LTDDLLICSYRDYLIAYLKKKFRRGRFEDIEDAVQNTLIKAVRFHDKWNKNCSLKTWLSIIAVNMYTDTFRKTYLRNEYLLDSSEDLFLFDQISVDDFSVKLCDDEQHSSLISDLFSDFKDNVHIEAFKLSVIDEIDYKEISIRQNIPMGTVKSRMFRAKKLLIEKYNQISDKYAVDAV
jgi:RNA polymerase sigma-70 factor (ECF subfamily)